MTVIAASRDGFMVADTLSTLSGYWKGPFETHKILDFGHTLLGSAGDAIFRQHAFKLLKGCTTPTSLLEKLVKIIKNDGFLENQFIAVTKDRDLYTIHGGTVLPLKAGIDFYAIGSGGDLILGYLGSTLNHAGKVTAVDAVDAIRFGAQYTVTINAEVDVVQLSNQKPRAKALSKPRAKKKTRARK